MCGLFGAVGRRINPHIIRALAIANRERGTDALGFFSNSGKMIKGAGDPLYTLGEEGFGAYIDKACAKGWFLAGHTRLSTCQNAKKDECAHPFRYGRYIGSHNGVVYPPKNSNYAVDSQYLIDQLQRCNGHYQEAFEDIAGYWALTWFDGECFYAQCHNNQITFGKYKGVWYYSSDYTHLEACVTCDPDTICMLDNGETIRFDCKLRVKSLPKFQSKSRWKATAKGAYRCLYSTRYDMDEEEDLRSYYTRTYPVAQHKAGKDATPPEDTSDGLEVEDEDILAREYRRWEGDDDWKEAWEEYTQGRESDEDE